MANGRTLSVSFTGALQANYARTDNDLNTENIKDIFSYVGLQDVLTNGQEADQADSFYHSVRSYVSGTTTINLDADLSDVFGNTLNFYRIKAVIVKNKSTVAGRFLTVTLQDEVMYIGPGGFRVIWEPSLPGLQDSGASTTGVTGNLVITGSGAADYDLIILGTSALINLSSG